MADILQRYGIKEVADVTFYHINQNGRPDYPVLVLDSLKVTSIEQTAETAEARGGRGNAKLVVWDFGKEITVNIEDALFSPKSLAIMMANGKVTGQGPSGTSEYGVIQKSARVIVTENNTFPIVKIDGTIVSNDEVKHTEAVNETTTTVTDGIAFYNGDSYKQSVPKPLASATGLSVGDVLFASWLHPVASKAIITITPDSFPGTYYVTGDTMIRSATNGEDSYFQFIIPKAKMQAEQTIELSADGDPATFKMNLQVLRPDNGEMVKFIKYEFAEVPTEDQNEVYNYVTDWDYNTANGTTVTAGDPSVKGKDGWKTSSNS